MNSPILLTEEEFDQQYPLLVNHLVQDATWTFDEGPGCLFGQSPDVRNAVLAGLALAGGSLGALALVSRRRRSVTARAER